MRFGFWLPWWLFPLYAIVWVCFLPVWIVLWACRAYQHRQATRRRQALRVSVEIRERQP